MSQTSHTARRLLATAAAVLAVSLVPIGAANAAAVSQGHVDWGFKAFVRTAFPAPPAEATPGNLFRIINSPASQNPDDTFRFPLDLGTSDYVNGDESVFCTATSGTPGTHTEGGFVKLGYVVGGWASTGSFPDEPTGATIAGIWSRFGGLCVFIDERTSPATGTLWGTVSGGYHGEASIAPAFAEIGTLGFSAASKTVPGTPPAGYPAGTVVWSGIQVTLTHPTLGYGLFPPSTPLDDLTVIFKP